jgi:tripartite-type tricarboxylate transporter receptor subunit TctC
MKLYHLRGMTSLAVLLATVLIGTGCGEAAAMFPSKPITIVVPTGPGAGQDVTARQLADRMAKITGQAVNVVNKTGGANAIGFNYALDRPHDGYTICTANRSLTLQPYTSGADIDYRKVRGLAKIVTDWYVLTVTGSAPWKTIDEFLAAAKANPTSMKFGGPNVGSTTHLTTIAFAKKAGIKFDWVPAPSGAEAMVAVLGGHTPVFFGELGETYGHYESKKLRYLAIASPERLKSLPDVPTLKEKGIDLVSDNWRALLVAADTPEPVVAKLESIIKQIVDDPTFISEVETSRSSVAFMGTAEFTKEYVRLNQEARQTAIDLGILKEAKK